jgi:hypothetical protein
MYLKRLYNDDQELKYECDVDEAKESTKAFESGHGSKQMFSRCLYVASTDTSGSQSIA